ncbi:unnamed protein product [Prunus armeniaca]
MMYDQFLIVDCPTTYNIIIGRMALTEVKAHLSLHMLVMKFPTCHGTSVIKGDQLSAWTCYATVLKLEALKPPRETLVVHGTQNSREPIDDPRNETPMPQAQPAEDLETVILNEDQPNRCVKIGSALTMEFIQSLHHHSEVFAWSYNDRNYTDLNKACPKGSFPLPRIDQLVDATAGHELLSFIDAYSRYNQIFMHHVDSEHTRFITDRGLYCYNVMLFGLKNAGATYQRLVNQIFAKDIDSTMEVYVDDMLVKSKTVDEHLHNLSLMFDILKEYRIRLNPTKCSFGVSFGKFIGFMVSQRGIEENPKKIKALINMERSKK